MIQFATAGAKLDHAALTTALQSSGDAVVRKPKTVAAKRPGKQKPAVTKKGGVPARKHSGLKSQRKAQSKRDSGSSSESGSGCDGESSVSSVTESEDEATEVPEPTISGKRIRKAVQHFDPITDGANDTKRRKESK